jgi:cytochrome oxidase Cu insertion factor (SCO1/SenC/PrrC family)
MPEAAPAPRRAPAVPLALGAALVALVILAIARSGGDDEPVARGTGGPPTAGPDGFDAGGEPRGKVLADFGALPEFRFVDHLSRPFTNESLAGRIWIVDFFFTSCPGPCLELTTKMRVLGNALRAEPDVHLLSVTVDPENDTPQALERYARSHGGGLPNWHWVTGDREQVKALCAAFLAAWGEKDPASGDISHSTRIHVVDREGRVRAIHDTQLPDEWKPAVLHSVRLLCSR